MVLTSVGNFDESVAMSNYDRKSELKAFDDSKAGVKGLVDAGITKIPRIFVHDRVMLDKIPVCRDSHISIPLIDFKGIDEDSSLRCEIIEKIGDSCENWGFFQVVNHGVPVKVMDEMIDGVRRFHEQETEAKKRYYFRDVKRKFNFNSNFDLYQAPAANWRDTISCVMAPDLPEPEQLPVVCRDITMEYSNYVSKFGLLLFELLSEALGLDPDHLKNMGCTDGLFVLGHYYPPCPEPELTFATSNHSDSGFLTVLIQDQIGGLQILHENQWVDVPPLHGALVVNIADLLQLITNDKFKSINHRVLAQKIGPRISVASFFRTHFSGSRVYGPMKELISEENPAIYKEVTIQEFLRVYYNKGLDGTSSLSHFRLDK